MKKNLKLLLQSLFPFILVFSIDIEGATVIHAGSLLDGTGSQPVKEMSIVIENEFISRVETGYIVPEPDDLYVDLTTYFVLPGLIDMHVHLDGEYSSKSYQESISSSAADYAIKAVANANKTLLAGFTSVRNLGDSNNVTVSLRNAVNRGVVSGPRIFSSGKTISSSGGHGDPTNSLRPDLSSDPGPSKGVINNKDDSFKAVRFRYKEGADLIKITATGGVLSNAKNGQNPQFTLEEIKSICDTAKDYGMIVAAHAHGDEGIQRAIIGGVTTIEHGTLMSDKSMELMKQYGTYFVPTISAGKEVAEKAKIKGYYDELVVPKALAIGPKLQSTFKKAYKAGVKIAFGSDAGVFPHGLNGKEFRYMNEVGMPAMECIQSATTTNALILGMENDLGQIKVGFIADIVATDDNPINLISTMENVVFVMKKGVVYK